MKRICGLLVVVMMIIIGISIMTFAHADIPEGVKYHYQYNTTDRSIVIVKERLLELGYFNSNSQLNNIVSEALKSAVISFQEQNALEPDAVIDQEFLEALFSDNAVGKNEKKKSESADKTISGTVNESSNSGSSEDADDTNVVSEKSTEKTGVNYEVLLIVIAIVIVVVGLALAFGSKGKRKTGDQQGVNNPDNQTSRQQGTYLKGVPRR